MCTKTELELIAALSECADVLSLAIRSPYSVTAQNRMDAALKRANSALVAALTVQEPSVKIAPDWSDAPEWANYMAMDEDGVWYFYECKPELRFVFFQFSQLGGRHEKWQRPYGHWKNTLSERGR